MECAHCDKAGLDVAVDSGVDVLAHAAPEAGTDAGYIDVYDTHQEYRLMAQAGLDWRQILASLTTAPAQRFGQSSLRGRLAEGYAGDLVVLGADPQLRPDAYAEVRMTVRDGRVIYDAAASPTP